MKILLLFLLSVSLVGCVNGRYNGPTVSFTGGFNGITAGFTLVGPAPALVQVSGTAPLP